MAFAERDGDDITVKTEYRDKDLIRSVPGARYNHQNDYLWRIPLSWASCLTLHGIFRERVEIGPVLATWWNEYRESYVLPMLQMREALDAEGDPDLFPFQRAGVAFHSRGRRTLITDDMGSGKTIQTIRTLMQHVRNGENPFPAFVACPNSMKYTWQKEFEQWWPGVISVVMDGGRVARLKELDKIKNGEAHVLIINWEALRSHSRLAPYGSIELKKCVKCDKAAREYVNGMKEEFDALTAAVEDHPTDELLAEQLKEAETAYKKAVRGRAQTACERCKRDLNDVAWKTIIGDEVHLIKEPTSKRTRAFFALSHASSVEFAHGLTGTPIADNPQDLWPALHAIRPKEFPTKGLYVDRWCLESFNPFGGRTIVGLKPETKDEFFHITDPIVRRMPKKLVLPQLPPKIYSKRWVDPTPKQAKAYEAMRKSMVTELLEGERLVAANPLTQLTRLTQFASSYAELDYDNLDDRGKPTVRLSEPSCKVDALMELVEELGGSSAGVFAASRQLIELCSARLTKEGIRHVCIVGGQTPGEREHFKTQFQSGEVPLVLATVGAGGTGITLTRGATCIRLQRSWRELDNQQAEDRFHRIGSEIHEQIQIIDVATRGTIEEGQFEVLAGKQERQQEVVRDDQLLKKLLGV